MSITNGTANRLHNGSLRLSHEQSLLASLLRDNSRLADVIPFLRKEDFATDAHQKIYQSMLDMFREGKPFDSVTLADALHQRNQIADLGGYHYLAELWNHEPTGVKAVHYAQIVRGQSLMVQLEHEATEIITMVRKRQGPPEEILQHAEQRIFGLSQLGHSGDTVALDRAMLETFSRLDRRADAGGTATGIASGFLDLDRLTGGFHDGELTVVGARPSQGKTSLGICLARNVALKLGLPIFFVSLEQSRHELCERLLCCHSSVDSLKLRKAMLAPEDWDRLFEARRSYEKTTIEIDDKSDQTVLRIRANARRLKLRHGIRMVIVDYLQLLAPEDRKSPRQEQVASMSRGLKLMARELSIPVIALAQLNREVEWRSDRKPRLSDLRESGAIEADADTVLLMHRPSQPEGVVEIHVAKQRNGPTGEITLTFRKRCMRFENYAEAS